MISVIVCSIDPAKFDRVSRQYGQLLGGGGEPYEMVGVHDATGLAEGYARGLARARGEVVIFSHDDIDILTPDLAARLRGHLDSHDLLGVAGATRVRDGYWVGSGPPYLYGQVAQHDAKTGGYAVHLWGAPAQRVGGIAVMDGVFLCARRAVAEAVPFDAETFPGFHVYDIDFTFRAHLAGFRLAVCADVPIAHASAGRFDARWAQDVLRFRQKHQGRLDPGPQRTWQTTVVRVRTREEAVEIMNPPHWAQHGGA
jgi:GT2 family glycosyltransferase